MDGVVNAITIAGRMVGRGQPCFIIAEAGVNHNGDVDMAKRLIEAAAKAGADAVKFQTFAAERLTTADAPKAGYQIRAAEDRESQRDMLRRLELSPEMHRELIGHCRRHAILFLSTPFDEESADLLDKLEVPAFKISSGEITNLPFLAHVARKGKPMIISTGMSTLAEVRTAVETVLDAGNKELALLHCVSGYPANPADVNLRAMATMGVAFQAPIGYSDHTRENDVALAAVALGACILEKHLTLDRSLPGPDHRASSEPGELAALIRGVRAVQAALGNGEKQPAAAEAEITAVARKSLVAARDIPAGSILAEEMIAIKRPGTGLPPAMRAQVVGRRAKQDIPAGAVLRQDMLA
jgi:N-acetylneuraminate synthase